MPHNLPGAALSVNDGPNRCTAPKRDALAEPARPASENRPEASLIVLSERERELLRVFSSMLVVSLADEANGLNPKDPAAAVTISAVATLPKSVGTVHEKLTAGNVPAIEPRPGR